MIFDHRTYYLKPAPSRRISRSMRSTATPAVQASWQARAVRDHRGRRRQQLRARVGLQGPGRSYRAAHRHVGRSRVDRLHKKSAELGALLKQENKILLPTSFFKLPGS